MGRKVDPQSNAQHGGFATLEGQTPFEIRNDLIGRSRRSRPRDGVFGRGDRRDRAAVALPSSPGRTAIRDGELGRPLFHLRPFIFRDR